MPTARASNALTIDAAMRSGRVIPMAARTGLCRESTCIRRENAWLTTTRPSNAASAANTSNAMTCGPVAWSTSAVTAAARWKAIDSCGTSARTRAVKASRSVPGARRTMAPQYGDCSWGWAARKAGVSSRDAGW